jgi:hypothetical protein
LQISAVTGEGVDRLLEAIWRTMTVEDGRLSPPSARRVHTVASGEPDARERE